MNIKFTLREKKKDKRRRKTKNKTHHKAGTVHCPSSVLV